MAKQISSETMARLVALAAPLLEQAVSEAEVFVDDGATPEDIAAAKLLQGLVMSSQAMLRTAPLTEEGVFSAMGAICGAVMANCNSDRAVLYQIFRDQFAAVLKEITAAAPIMAPAQGNA